MNTYIKQFNEISISDVPTVGGKNASLGEMFSRLSQSGILVPDGFATTAYAFREFLSYNRLDERLERLMCGLDKTNYSNLRELGLKARQLLLQAELPTGLKDAATAAYSHVCGNGTIAVAVRSSATAEDLPEASFAGQHESFLNIEGNDALLAAIKKCFISLYTDRAIKYREDNHFKHSDVALSVGVQKMVRSDMACSGVCFTLEPESGFRDIIHISGVWGLGENIVQGTVTPDEFFIFKPTLRAGKNALVQKKLGDKNKTMVYGSGPENTIENLDTPTEKRDRFVLTDKEISQLANWALVIEAHYKKPMDIEWAKDGLNNQLYIIQARPETVHSRTNPLVVKEYKLAGKGVELASGNAIGSKICTGIARVLQSASESGKLRQGEIVVTDLTSPDWDPVLKKAGGIITNKGGRTSHASIVARELGVPAIVGCDNATGNISDGQLITLDCSGGKKGVVYAGEIAFTESDLDFTNIHKPESTGVMLIAGDPDKAFQLSFYPNDGVGLMRLEFIITHSVQVHPMALVNFEQLKDAAVKKGIENISRHYTDKKQYFIDKLAEGIATIAAAFYPKDVIVRTSDFKTNEYANLLGGTQFEPHEENPMIGFRGASRYYNDLYRPGFKLECGALKKVRDEMGFTNVKVMIPFCRTVEEGKKVIAEMAQNGLVQGQNFLEIYVMAEIPSNVILAEEFAGIFDGFSIGSNDLTQLILGLDRDSAIVSNLFSEQNAAVKEMIATMIRKAKHAGAKIGLCGQAPSDYPAFAQFLVEQGIDSISFNADALLKGIENVNKAELQFVAMG
jgi:pyruvate,water dikinase